MRKNNLKLKCMAKKKEVRLKKIPLAAFIETLTDLLSFGVEYIDIIGTPGEEQDSIGIIYSNEYISKEVADKFDKALDEFLKDNIDEIKDEIKKDIKLSDDDLNQLS
jgi:hypothetical protein